MILLIILLSTACGGGGSSQGFVGAATVKITAEPNKIDTGDRMQLTVILEDVSENNIILKIRYPESLKYVLSSSFLNIDSETLDVSPAFNLNDDGKNYLVYFLAASIFNETSKGELTLQLEGISLLEKGEVEVDADVDDPLINNNVEFDVSQPEFAAESSSDIEVIG